MSAQPVHGLPPDPDDPDEILKVLPEEYHGLFRADYDDAAATAAWDVQGYQMLRVLLRLWSLRALAYSQPGFEEGLATVKESLGRGEGVPAGLANPGWAEKFAARRAAESASRR